MQENQHSSLLLDQLLARLDKLTLTMEKLLDADHKHELSMAQITARLEAIARQAEEKNIAITRANTRIDEHEKQKAEDAKKFIWWIATSVGAAVLGIIVNATGWLAGAHQ